MKEHIKRLHHLAQSPENSEPWKVDALMDAAALIEAAQPRSDEQETELCKQLAELCMERGVDGAVDIIRTTRVESRAVGWIMRGQNAEMLAERRTVFDPELVRALLLEISRTEFGAGWDSLLAAAHALAESERKLVST